MPELPEVETVVRGLRRVLPGRRIVEVRLGKTDFIEDPAALELHLRGSRVEGVRRYGKFLVFDLASSDGKGDGTGDGAVNGAGNPLALLIHLGMTGQLVVCAADAESAEHTHVFFALDDGRELRYTDIRRFGSMRVLVNGASESALGGLGLD